MDCYYISIYKCADLIEPLQAIGLAIARYLVDQTDQTTFHVGLH